MDITDTDGGGLSYILATLYLSINIALLSPYSIHNILMTRDVLFTKLGEKTTGGGCDWWTSRAKTEAGAERSSSALSSHQLSVVIFLSV